MGNSDAGLGDSRGNDGAGVGAGEDVRAVRAVSGIRTGVNPSPHTGANLPSLRSHNSALVLDLLRTAGEGGISRLELAESTGLTPQAVSKITARLRTEGLAAEAGQRASTGGKPRTVLCLVPSAAHAVGLHLDRDELTAVVVDLAGTPVAARTVPFDLGAGAAEVVEIAAAQVESVRAEAEARAAATGATRGCRVDQAGSGSGVWCVRSQGGGGRHGGAMPTDDNGGGTSRARRATGESVRARDREPGKIHTTAPRAGVGGGSPGGLLGVGVAMPGPLDHTTGVPQRVTGFPQWDGFPLRDALAARLGLPVVLDKDTNAAALGLALSGPGDSFAYLHLGTGLGAGLVLGGALYRGDRTGAGEFGHQVIQLDGPLCDCGNRGCIEALCMAAVARGDLAEAARVLGAGAANLVGLLDIDRVLLGGRAVAAAEERFVTGVGAVLEERARGPVVPVAVACGGAYSVAEGAAQLVLAPVFGHARVFGRGRR